MSKSKIKLRNLKQYSEADIEANKKIYTEYFDIEMVRNMNEQMFYLLENYYFRPQFIGF